MRGKLNENISHLTYRMRKTLFLLLTTAFFGVQILSTAHAAEYGSQEHKHEGTECEICINAKYQDYTDPGATRELRVTHRTQHIPQPPADFIVVLDTCEAGITRGPPTSSRAANRLFIPRTYMRAAEFSFQT